MNIATLRNWWNLYVHMFLLLAVSVLTTIAVYKITQIDPDLSWLGSLSESSQSLREHAIRDMERCRSKMGNTPTSQWPKLTRDRYELSRAIVEN